MLPNPSSFKRFKKEESVAKMLPPEEQPTDFEDRNQKEFPSSESLSVLKTLDFQFSKPLEKVTEEEDEFGEKCPSECHISKNPAQNSEEGFDPETFPIKEKVDPQEGRGMSPNPPMMEFDSNLTSTTTTTTEEVGNALKELENGLSPEPSQIQESIVRATFVDFSPEDGGSNSEELGKEFSLTLSPDLPKIRAQQIQNWLEFEKDADKKPQQEAGDGVGESPQRSREASPPQDFELDSLTLMGAVGGSPGVGVGDHTVTDADGLQRRVRFLTDPQGNILISVFLTNVDGEEEEQQQVIHFGPETGIQGHTLIPDGINLNFPEIESQLAAFVSHTQAQQLAAQAKGGELVDTDQILKELGVEKDDETGTGKGEKGVEDVTEGGDDGGKVTGGKTRIPAGPSLSVFDEGDDGGGSDTETMSTSSCSSMIEVKPKEGGTGGNVKEKGKNILEEMDENNNEIREDVGETFGDRSQGSGRSDDTEMITHEDPLFELEPPKFSPKLVEIELKGCPKPPPAPITPSAQKSHPPSSVNLPFLVKNGEGHNHDEPCYTSNENVVTVQVMSGGGGLDGTQPYDLDQAEQQFESLCIEEEPICAVAETIAKWESFSRKQQAAAESGERVNIAVKGLGKLILPMYHPGQGHPGQNGGNNGQQQYVNTAPIKMGGPAPPAKPMKQQQHQGNNNHYQNQSNNGSSSNNKMNNNGNNANGSNNNKLWNGCGWGNNGNSAHNQNHSKMFGQLDKVEYEEETIYAQPNSQAGTLNMIVNSSNPSTLLKSYPKPNSRGEIINWFKEGEIHRSGILLSYGQSSTHHSTHIVPQPITGPIVVSWFFGLINRQQSEELLQGQPCGTFLVRISTRVWGYTLSYQSDNNKTKHFLISAINPAVAATLSAGPGGGGNGNDLKNGPLLPTGKQQLLFPFSPGGRYAFIGTNMTPYSTLTSLIRHHSHASITKAGGEKLLYPCPGGPKIAGIEYVFK